MWRYFPNTRRYANDLAHTHGLRAKTSSQYTTTSSRQENVVKPAAVAVIRLRYRRRVGRPAPTRRLHAAADTREVCRISPSERVPASGTLPRGNSPGSMACDGRVGFARSVAGCRRKERHEEALIILHLDSCFWRCARRGTRSGPISELVPACRADRKLFLSACTRSSGKESSRRGLSVFGPSQREHCHLRLSLSRGARHTPANGSGRL